MSWNVWLEIDAEEVADCGDMTWNVSPMYYDAFDLEHGIRGLDGMTGEEASKHLVVAISKMVSDPDKYKAMNPENGWGCYGGALEFLITIRKSCDDNPKATVVVM